MILLHDISDNRESLFDSHKDKYSDTGTLKKTLKKERSKRLVTLETFDQSDEGTVQQKDNDETKDIQTDLV